VCHEQIFATPNPMFRRVEVTVADVLYPERRIIKLDQLVPR
jgi:general secretion pathway protein I